MKSFLRSALKQQHSGARARLCVGGAPRAGGGVGRSPEEMLLFQHYQPCSSVCVVVFFTFDFQVVSSETVGLKVEGQRRVGLIQEQVDPGQLNAVPLKHWT